MRITQAGYFFIGLIVSLLAAIVFFQLNMPVFYLISMVGVPVFGVFYGEALVTQRTRQ